MKKRGLLIIVLVAAVSFTAFGQNAKAFVKAGQKFMVSLNYEAAMEQFSRAIDVDPNNSAGYVARAEAYEGMLKYDEAYKDLQKALVMAPKDVKILLGLGRVCNARMNFEEALGYLNRATAIDKRNTLVYPEKVTTLMGLKRYDQALKASDTALLLKDISMNYYQRGLVYVSLNNDVMGKRELEKAVSKDKNNPLPRIALVDLLIKEGKIGEALGQANMVLQKDDKNTAAYAARSRVYVASMDFPNAINDVSKNIVIEPNNPKHYFDRGILYQKFNQHSNAINDFTKFITLKSDDPEVYFARAASYEEIQNIEKAIADYTKITELSEFDPNARKRLKEANDRLFAMNREAVAPEITILSPQPVGDVLEVRGDNSTVLISGRIVDKSKIDTLLINKERIQVIENNGVYEFVASVSVAGVSSVVISARDVYGNLKTLNYGIRQTEIVPPRISVVAPYASDDGTIYLDNNNPTQRIEGKIADDSRIRSIFIEGTTASYTVNDLNPSFFATVDGMNKNKITIIAEDIYGNKQESVFSLNREGAQLAETNPMGRTWVVFIENSDYTTFASLEGPGKDITLMQRALANYQVHNVIHKRNMTKLELERFFSIELRDQIRANNVKSLMLWYAGHGKMINDIGYWIPVDAKRDDEFTYFNINGLRAAMEAYVNVINHLLVVTDACESGPSFYTAMRATDEKRSCDDYRATQMKSSQVFSSAGTELAMDNSQFTQTFYNSLVNNPNACIPIDEIVNNVKKAVVANQKQEPKFGKITGLRDENGTFFFIAK
jgi:tetratricopeptide (TPR) repeat protein